MTTGVTRKCEMGLTPEKTHLEDETHVHPTGLFKQPESERTLPFENARMRETERGTKATDMERIVSSNTVLV